MPALAPRIHPDPKRFPRLPGSIHVPLFRANNEKFGSGGTGLRYLTPWVNVLDYIEPAPGQIHVISAAHPRGEPMLASVPRLRMYYRNSSGGGNPTITVFTRSVDGEPQIIQRQDGGLGTSPLIYEEPICTKWVRIGFQKSFNPIYFYASIGLIYDPD